MTRLASIKMNHLYLSCSVCGHAAQIPVTALIDAFGPETSVHSATSRARCRRCKAKGQNTFRIIYVGEGWDALQGAKVKE